MDKTTVRIRIIAALGMDSRQYRNFTRSLFELWATVIARQQNLLLESITTNISLWQWYLDEFEIIEQRFYNENNAYVDALLDAAILNDVLVSMAEEIEEYYPSALIKMYCNEKKKITKVEIASIIVQLTQWLEINSPFHYMYIVVNNELNNYKAQLALMEEQNENEWDNKVPTEYYKQLEWIDDTARMIFY